MQMFFYIDIDNLCDIDNPVGGGIFCDVMDCNCPLWGGILNAESALCMKVKYSALEMLARSRQKR